MMGDDEGDLVSILDGALGDGGSTALSARLAFLSRREPGGMVNDEAAVGSGGGEEEGQVVGALEALSSSTENECSLPVLATLHVEMLLLLPVLRSPPGLVHQCDELRPNGECSHSV